MTKNAVGIDVFKGKSMIAVMRPFEEVVYSPFEISHTDSELIELEKMIKSLPGETHVVMKYTGYYHAPVAQVLCEEGIYVSVVNAMLIHNYGNNTLRRAKTDKKRILMDWDKSDSCLLILVSHRIFCNLLSSLPCGSIFAMLKILNFYLTFVCRSYLNSQKHTTSVMLDMPNNV